MLFEALKFLDQIKFKLNRNPRCKLKSYVFVCIGAAVTTCFGNQSNGTGFEYPLFGSENKTVEPSLISNPIEFDGIKIMIVELYSKPKKSPSQFNVRGFLFCCFMCYCRLRVT